MRKKIVIQSLSPESLTSQAIWNSRIEGLEVTPEQAEQAHVEVVRMVATGEDLKLARRMLGTNSPTPEKRSRETKALNLKDPGHQAKA